MRDHEKELAMRALGPRLTHSLSIPTACLAGLVGLVAQPTCASPPGGSAASGRPGREAGASIGSARAFSLDDRVACQTAIEAVYHRHRIWPRDNKAPKPALAAVLRPEVIARRAEDALRLSDAAAALWQRPVTPAQLLAEMDRMARETRDPKLLAELHAALGNDPGRVAECLARPVLVEREVRDWYAFDPRFHAETRALAESELARWHTVSDLRRGQAEVSEVALAVDEASEGPGALAPAMDAGETVRMEPSEFAEALARHEAVAGHVGALREDEQGYFVEQVLERTSERLRVATVRWPKRDFADWWREQRGGFASEPLETGATYVLAAPAAGGCVENTWRDTAGALIGRYLHTAVWTGAEMIVWGGWGSTALGDGMRFDPATAVWTKIGAGSAGPSARSDHTAVWPGTEMIVWGGRNGQGDPLGDGKRYDPSSDSWSAVIGGQTTGPFARSGHSAIWTGTEMIVWGGFPSGSLGDGRRYDPASDTWSFPIGFFDGPTGRFDHGAVWTGTEMIVWGGVGTTGGLAGAYLNDGQRYDPGTDSWSPAIASTGAPTGRSGFAPLWTGTEMIVWGGASASGGVGNGKRYSPSTDTWSAPMGGGGGTPPTARQRFAAVWTGDQMILWGGLGSGGNVGDGKRYEPATDRWLALATGPLSARQRATGVWTGSEMILWGGVASSGNQNDGARYDPSTDSWVSTGGAGAPSARSRHSAVWTGTEMIVWGGVDADYFADGKRYFPATNSWSAPMGAGGGTSPTARIGHTALWTGTEMIVWGGTNFSGKLATGKRYDPATDAWSAALGAGGGTSPEARFAHTAVWTGSEMIVWGGSGSVSLLDDGKRYDLASDTWSSPIGSGGGTPLSRRSQHSAVWTGAEMIVWGGIGSGNVRRSDGNRYDPATDVWSAPLGAGGGTPPAARSEHTAVWTGSEMIVWGGTNSTPALVGDGKRYDPATDAWSAALGGGGGTNPSPRALHSAIWTGSEMIVWGGANASLTGLYTGGRYSPALDTWTPTSSVGVPVERYSHTAVWTGTQMIVWGGSTSSATTATGGLYCAVSTPGQGVTIEFAAATSSVGEGAGAASLQAILTTSDGQPTTAEATVSFTAIDIGSASPEGVDFTAVGDLLTFPAGSASGAVAPFDVPITDDGETEDSEVFRVNLNGPTGAVLGPTFEQDVTILDDDAADLLSDGFESGSTSAWAYPVPPG
jgi:N-acetylneuraminic acid mutarotase